MVSVTNVLEGWQAYVKRATLTKLTWTLTWERGRLSTLLGKLSPNNVCEGQRGNVSGNVCATNVGVNVALTLVRNISEKGVCH